MNESHTELQRWSRRDFPFDIDDEYVRESLHTVLPMGYWLAEDYSADDEVAIVLMRADDHYE